MKIALTYILLVIAVFTCGCTATSPVSTAPVTLTTPVTGVAAPATPDMVGTWSGTMLGYEEGTGFTDYHNTPITMVVTEQQGRLFAGNLTFGVNSTKPLAFAGVIGRDSRTFALVENVNGYTTGELIGTDTMELIHVDDADPYSVALDTLKRT